MFDKWPFHLHNNVFERECEAISGNFAVLPEIATHPQCKSEKLIVKMAIMH